jgi:hypothetical protein
VDKLRELMSRKVFGVPVMALAALFAGALLYAAFKMKSSVSDEELTDASATDTDTEMATGDGDDSNEQPAFIVPGSRLNTGGVSSDTGTVPEVPGVAVPTTNDLWRAEVTSWLSGQGLSGTDAAMLMANYFNGVSMTAENSAWINKAIAKFGQPPEGPPDYVSLPTTPGQVPEVPLPAGPSQEQRQVTYAKSHGGKQFSGTGKHFVQGTHGDTTFVGLAKLYYGDSRMGVRIKAQSYNAGYREPFPKHRIVYIPAYVTPRYYTIPRTGRTDKAWVAAKNGTTVSTLEKLNPGYRWPGKRGSRVRVK